MKCDKQQICADCGHYSYDTHYDESSCSLNGLIVNGGDNGCENWICQYREWYEDTSKVNGLLREEVQKLTALYEAERLLRKAAEQNCHPREGE